MEGESAMPQRVIGRIVVCGVVAAAVSLLAATGGAQQPAPADKGHWVMATLVTVQPGTGADYVEFQKNEVIPAQKKGGLPGRTAYSSGVFGETGTFAFFTPVTSLAAFDGESPVRKALGAEGAAALGARGAKLTAARRVLLARTRPDLSYNPDPKAAPSPLALVTRVEIAPGKRGEFETLIKKHVVPVMQQANVKSYQMLEVVYGDAGGTYFSAVGYDTYEAIGKGHPFQIVLGEEGAKRLEANFTGVVTRLERFVVRYRADLSFASTPPTN